MRYSIQRDLILNTVRDNRVHPTADRVYSLLKEEYPNLSLGTVYRNLNQLADSGDLLRIKVFGDGDHYDGTLKPHFHMKCTNCGEVVDIPFEAASDIDKRAEELTGVKILAYDIAFSGICNKCNNNKGDVS